MTLRATHTACVALFAGLTAALVGCGPDPVQPADKRSLATPASPIVNDWRVEATEKDIRAAVDQISQEKQMSAAEADASLQLPNWGVWADLNEQQARDLYVNIPLDVGLKYTYGSGENELVVFVDPHNQNDRRLLGLLRSESQKLNATVYVFPLPSAPPVGNVARILCTQSPEDAWADWVAQIAAKKEDLGSIFTPRLDEKEELKRWKSWELNHPEILGCDARRVDKIEAIAGDLGVVFTPTVVFAHGRAWPGQFPELADIQSTWAYAHGKLGLPRR